MGRSLDCLAYLGRDCTDKLANRLLKSFRPGNKLLPKRRGQGSNFFFFRRRKISATMGTATAKTIATIRSGETSAFEGGAKRTCMLSDADCAWFPTSSDATTNISMIPGADCAGIVAVQALPPAKFIESISHPPPASRHWSATSTGP